MLGNLRLVDVQLMAFRHELGEFGVEPRRIIEGSGINGVDCRGVMRCAKWQAATMRAEMRRCWLAAVSGLRISLDFAFECKICGSHYVHRQPSRAGSALTIPAM